MKKVILMSVRPEQLFKILYGEKTVEIRKTIPNCTLPIDVYLYCTKAKNEFERLEKQDGEYYYGDPCYTGLETELNELIVAKFTLKYVEIFPKMEIELDFGRETNYYDISLDRLDRICLTTDELLEYGKGKELYGWYIDNLKIFDSPMELSDFYKANYKQIQERLETIGCEIEKEYCLYAVENLTLGDDGYCDFENCLKLRISKPPRSWFYAYVKEE